jgi:A/G-specific adenine glycosylase
MDFQRRYPCPPDAHQIESFQQAVLGYYRSCGRVFPWRKNISPYRVFVSEIMLQQTQVLRVEPKFLRWMEEVPGFADLAGLSTERLLALWQGLGYNRRALALREGAQKVMAEFAGELPDNPELLRSLPGIGPATAASICAFAFNRPVVFIETNIRRVFIHFFFTGAEGINDAELTPLVEASLYRESPRDWYNALMDIGTELKSRVPNPNRRSRHYVRQAPFEGSNRQARGAILKILQRSPRFSAEEIAGATGIEYSRISKAAEALVREGFLVAENGEYGLK